MKQLSNLLPSTPTKENIKDFVKSKVRPSKRNLVFFKALKEFAELGYRKCEDYAKEKGYSEFSESGIDVKRIERDIKVPIKDETLIKMENDVKEYKQKLISKGEYSIKHSDYFKVKL